MFYFQPSKIKLIQAYRSVAIELKSPELGRWIPYTRINHKRDYITSKLAIYYEDDVPVRVRNFSCNHFFF